MSLGKLLFPKKENATEQQQPAQTWPPKISPPLSPERPAGEVEARQVLPIPFECSNPHYSLVYPVLDDPARPNLRLIELSVNATTFASTVDLKFVTDRMASEPHWPNIWPGEHYKLLAGLISALKPKLVIEIGTSTGLSALTMKKFLPTTGRVVTYDIVPWNEFSNTGLRESDFDGQLEQRIADLSNAQVFAEHAEFLKGADFIFIDAAKDSVQEEVFIANFSKIKFERKPIFMFDDIRLWNMLKIWRELQRPKLDVTSFGHWSGTGLVDWVG
jgi:predicted O-methyltransferase YrrM